MELGDVYICLEYMPLLGLKMNTISIRNVARLKVLKSWWYKVVSKYVNLHTSCTHNLIVAAESSEVVPKQTCNQTVWSYPKLYGPLVPKNLIMTLQVDLYPQTIKRYYYNKKIELLVVFLGHLIESLE